MRKLYIFLVAIVGCATLTAQNIPGNNRTGRIAERYNTIYKQGKEIDHHGVAAPQNPMDSVQQAWTELYNGTGNSNDFGYAIAADGEGNIYVTGASEGAATGFDYATVKYNSMGTEVWTARYNGPGDGDDVAMDIAVDNSGNVYVTGWSNTSGLYDYDYATIKYNSSGVEQWVARYDGPENDDDEATAIDIDESGNVYVTGYSMDTTYYDYTTVKYDQMGVQQWVARYDGGGNDADQAWDILVDNNGNVFVTGNGSSVSDGWDIVTIKYNSAGTEVWNDRYDGAGGIMADDDIGRAIASDGMGDIYVTGHTNNGSSRDFTTLKYDSLGTQLWAQIYDGPAASDDYAGAISVDQGGDVYVGGMSVGMSFTFDYAAIKYSAMGTELWVSRYDAGGDDICNAIATDNNDNLYVTGSSMRGASLDYVTLKYDNSGAEQWVSDFDGTGSDDNAFDIVVDDSTNVYVTGQSQGMGGTTDYATVKYEQLIVPVELASFSAGVKSNKVILNWVTATELNNRGFDIERKSTHTEFEKIGYITGNGTTTEPKLYSFIDKDVTEGTYSYRLKQLDFNGTSTYSKIVEVNVSNPHEFRLSQNYPNPFNPTTLISYTLPEGGIVQLSIYNALGQQVAELVNQAEKAGSHQVNFDASKLSSGVYYYRLKTAGNTITKKMMLLR